MATYKQITRRLNFKVFSCLTYKNCQPSKTPIKPEMPDHLCTMRAADDFFLQGYYYLLIVDYYSNIIAVENLRNPQPETAISKCKKVFSQFGKPKELIMEDSPKLSHKW